MKEQGYQYIPWGHKVNITYILYEGTWISIYTVGTQGEYYISYMKKHGYQYTPWGHKLNIIFPK